MAWLNNSIVRKLKNKKFNLFLFFLLLAILFSLLTKFSKDYNQTLNLEVAIENIPEGLVILENENNLIEVNISTYGFKLISYYFVRPIIKIDATELQRSDSSLLWTRQDGFSKVAAQFDSNVKINAIKPDSLFFEFDRNAIKKVPVVIDLELNFKAGYDAMFEVKPNPDSVNLIGPQAILDTIHQIETQTLILNELSSDISETVELKFPENDQLSSKTKVINISAKVDKFTEAKIEVPVIIKNVPENRRITIYPKLAELVYYAPLEGFETIASNSFIVECDYSKLVEGQDYLIPYIAEYPDGIKSARMVTKRIEYIISE